MREAFSRYSATHPRLRGARASRWFRDAGFSDESIGEDASFDQWYLCLYLLRLTRQSSIPISQNNVSHDLREMFRLRTMHKLSLGPSGDLGSFSETLIDEHTVADIMLFTSRVRHLIPYETHVRSIETGCLWFEFSVYGLPKKRVNDLPLLRKKDIEAGVDDTAHPEWRALKRRFKIEASELNPV